jgi:predicted dehydrogenase
MTDPVSIALVGLGGYGQFYLRALLGASTRGYDVRLVAGVDPEPERCRNLEQLKAAGVPIYPDLARFYEDAAEVSRPAADLVVIAAPIQLHAPLTKLALSKGACVLCEKPVAPTIQDAQGMLAAEKEAEGFVAIGYQWSFSEAIQALKRDVCASALGQPVRLKTKVLWPRPASYYARNNWAGGLKTPDGHWILDSPANNATAHYLHNMFYVLGETVETSARPVDVQAELYRANVIENYDTAVIRAHTESGVEVLFYTAHPVPNNIGPIFDFEFEDAVVTYETGEEIVARFHDGRTKSYGNPFLDDTNKLWQSVDLVRRMHAAVSSTESDTDTVRRRSPTEAQPVCGIPAAMSQTLCVNGAQESVSEIMTFPRHLVRKDCDEEDCLTWVTGLQEALAQSYEQNALPSEIGDWDWARAGDLVDLRDYHTFPSES